MPNIPFTEALRKEYENLFNSCMIRLERALLVDGIVANLVANKNRYHTVSETQGTPWSFIAVVHNMEASLNFTKHLHNGDPLSSRTVQVPADRPKKGNPPFTWEESASDALSIKGLGFQTDWSLAGTLYQLERYNGWGCRLYHQHVLTPYLWSFANHYISGKYVADGTWSDIAVSKQCGAAVLLRRMAETGVISFPDQPNHGVDSKPLLANYSLKKPEDRSIIMIVEDLQRWLNTFPGIFVKIDGVPGNLTSEAYKKVTGLFLPGDPRG